MSDANKSSAALPVYRVRARNTAVESDNKIHDDEVAAKYGFRGGLVPGVIVYAYMTAPLVARFGEGYLGRGSMQVKFHQPFYEGEGVVVRAEVDDDAEPTKIAVRAEREDGTVGATGLATVNDAARWLGEAKGEEYPERALPEFASRPEAVRENLIAGAALGTLAVTVDLRELEATYLPNIQERLPIYTGATGAAHPGYLLGLANEIFVKNFRLKPWIHVGSDLINHGVVRDGERLSVRGRIRDVFERKGHEMVTLDLLLLAGEDRVVQQVRHTAIYKIREKIDE